MPNISGRGGKRKGAGRKKGTGAFKEATIVKRIPISAVSTIELFLEQLKKQVALNLIPPTSFLFKNTLNSSNIPLALEPVRAGYPTHADSKIDHFIDFNEYFSGNKKNVMGVYAEGNSMCDAGIDDGDLLIVKTDLNPKEKDIVIAKINEDFTVKRLHFGTEGIELLPENILENYPIIKPSQNDQIQIIGIVTFIIKQLL